MFAETDRISPHLRQKLLLFYLKLHLEQTQRVQVHNLQVLLNIFIFF